MNTDFICKTAMDVPGYTTSEQHKLYAKLAKALPDNARVLEIGCAWGRSTWAWLDCLPSTSKFYVIDNFLIDNRRLLEATNNISKVKNLHRKKITARQIFDSVINQHPNKNIIKHVWESDSQEWIKSKNFTKEWDLVFLDECHTYESTAKWLNLFSDVPVVCGDDYNEKKYSGLVKAVNEYKNKEINIENNFFVIKN